MTSSSTLPVDSPALLAALVDLDGVDGAMPEATGEVRVQLNDDCDPDVVRASIASMLRDRFGVLGVSTSAVEEVGGLAGHGIGHGDGRLALERLHLVTGDRGARAEAVVRLDGRTATGSASDADSGSDLNGGAGGHEESGPAGRPDAVAAAITTALLLALEELTEDAVIGGIERIGVDPDGVARVRLRLDVDGADVLAVGEAAVVGHRPQAVVRAVLAAVEPHLP